MATLQMYMNQSKIENMFTSEVYEEVWEKNLVWIILWERSAEFCFTVPARRSGS